MINKQATPPIQPMLLYFLSLLEGKLRPFVRYSARAIDTDVRPVRSTVSQRPTAIMDKNREVEAICNLSCLSYFQSLTNGHGETGKVKVEVCFLT